MADQIPPGAPVAPKGEQVARNAAFLTAGQIAARALGALWMIFLARHLGAQRYGTYALATSFVGFVAIVSDLGVGTILLRRLVQEPERAPGLLAAGLRLVSLLSIAAFALAIGLTVALGYRGEVLLISAVASLAIIPNAVGSVALTVFQSRNRFGVFTTFVLTNLVMSIVFGAVALAIGGGVLGLAAAILIAAALNAAAAWSLSWRLLRPDRGHAAGYVKPLFLAALPIGLAAYGQTAAFQVDNLLVGHALGLKVLAYYDVAFIFYSSAVEVFLTPLLGVTFPLLSRIALEGGEELSRVLRRMFSLALAVVLPITVGGALLSTRIITLVFGPSYRPGGHVLRILVLALVPTAYWGIVTKVMVVKGRHAAYIATFLGLLAFAAAGVWVGLRLDGLTGAAVGVLAAHVGTAALAAILLRENAWVFDLGRIVKMVLAAAAMGAVVWLLRALPVVLLGAVGAAVYVPLALGLGVLDEYDRQALLGGLWNPLTRFLNVPRSR